MSDVRGANSQVDRLPDFELIFNSVPGLYLVLTPDFRIRAVSNRYLQATMTERSAILGRGIFEVFPDDPSAGDSTGERNLRASLEYVLQNKVPDTMAVQKYPIRVPGANDDQFEVRYWSPTNTPVLSESGQQVLYIIHRVEDVTDYVRSVAKATDDQKLALLSRERTEQMQAEVYLRAQEIQQANAELKLAQAELRRLNELLQSTSLQREEALKSSDERFRLLVDGVKDYAIFMLDCEGRITSWNRGAERIYGYHESEVLFKHYGLFFSEADCLAGHHEREMKIAQTGNSVEEKGWRLRRDGSRFWANGVLTALFDERGLVRGYAKISRDLTESRRTQNLLQSIVDTAIDGIITIDSYGVINTYNRACERIFGYAANEAIGRNITMLMPEPHCSDHHQYIDDYLRTGHAKTIGIGREVEGKRKDGSLFPLDLAISEFDQDGQRCFTGFLRDISARKELERQYQHSQKMEAVGKLAGGIAHDFNNLLTVILGYSELLRTNPDLKNEYREAIDEIHHAGSHAAMLTRQLLTFSRHHANQPVVIEINTIVRDAVRMLNRLIGEDVQLVTDLSATDCHVRVDPGQIEQVILNLAINARDAMPQGGQLTISTCSQFVGKSSTVSQPVSEGIRSGEYVVLSVSDNGEGIPTEIQSRIFDPFFTTKPVGKGTGLGLTVVDGIVRQSRGYLRLCSQPGEGTTVRIYLPRQTAEPSSQSSSSAKPLPRGHETILLVEDDMAVREFTSRSLAMCGYEVIKASDAIEAMQFLRTTDKHIALLLTDIVMPEMSGVALIEAARSKHAQMKWLMVSGYTADIVASKLALASDTPILQKPFTLESLAIAVRDALA